MTAPRCSIVASWMPSSPEECTATPSWNVSQTPAARMHGRMPPQKVVSSRITSAAVESALAASCSKLTTIGIGRQRHAHLLPNPAHPRHAVDGVFQVVIADALDLLAEPDGRLGRPDAVGVEAEAVAVELGRETRGSIPARTRAGRRPP